MKRSITSALFLLISTFGYAQTNTFPASGSVGIGTTTPDVQLEVNGGAVRLENSTGYPYGFNIDMNVSGGWAREYSFSYNGTGKFFAFGVNGTAGTFNYGYIGGNSLDGQVYTAPWLSFRPNGNIGIGTTSPSKRLDIKGDGINLESTTYSSQHGIIYKNGSSFISNFNYGDNGTVTTGGANTFIGINAGNFTMGSSAVAAYESSYNTAVGQGTLNHNTTGYHNTIIGSSGLTQNTTGYNNTAAGFASLGKNTAGSNNTASGYASLYNNASGSNNTAFGYQAGRSAAGSVADNTGSNNGVFIGANTRALNATDNNEIVIGYGATGAGSNSVVLGNASIATTLLQGNVGIGTSSPQSRLAVNGTITAQKVKVTQDGWPDYVFDTAYQFPPLRELERFIAQNKHLPQMPSAKEIADSGLDVGEMQKLQMRKIEELTLYLIAEDKRNQELQAALDALKKEFEEFKNKSK